MRCWSGGKVLGCWMLEFKVESSIPWIADLDPVVIQWFRQISTFSPLVRHYSATPIPLPANGSQIFDYIKMPSKNILAADASTLMFGVKMVFPVLQSVAVLLGELLWGFRVFVWICCCSSMWILASYGQGDEIDAIRSVTIFSISFFCSIITPHLPAWFAALFGGQHPVAAHAPPAHLFLNATIIMFAVLLGLIFLNHTSASEKTDFDSIQGDWWT
uniref:Uncharacterized protein n=1 Tax=Ditylenchus dipsaci TaxID=166011 RepID=A0A915DZW5_9BILA